VYIWSLNNRVKFRTKIPMHCCNINKGRKGDFFLVHLGTYLYFIVQTGPYAFSVDSFQRHDNVCKHLSYTYITWVTNHNDAPPRLYISWYSLHSPFSSNGCETLQWFILLTGCRVCSRNSALSLEIYTLLRNSTFYTLFFCNSVYH